MELTKKEKRNALSKKWYANNRATHIGRVVARRARNKDTVDNLKRKPCTDCKRSYPPYVMQFDHLGDKEHNVAFMVGGGLLLKRILAEIAKCELVCANCHAERTHKRS